MFVYKITNKINGKVYIGMDSGMIEDATRWRAHLQEGKRATSDSPKRLYQAMAKYGIENFTYEVIESNITNQSVLRARETFWIRELDSIRHGYNMQEGGGAPLLDYLPPEKAESLREIRRQTAIKNNRKRWSDVSDSDRKAMTAHLHTPDLVKQRSNTLKEYWSNRDDATENQLRGLKTQWLGLSLAEKRSRTERRGGLFTAKSYIAISPEGVVYHTQNINEFCKVHNLTPSGMRAVARGNYPKHKGWTCKNKDSE
jgi:group I intron endonuclease